MLNVKITQIGSTTNILLKYNQHLDFIDNKTAIDLQLQNNKKN